MGILDLRPSVNPCVGKQINGFVQWLNQEENFQEDVTIAVTGAKFVYNSITMEKVLGTFFAPFDGSELLPFMKVATGNFFTDVTSQGFNQARKDVLEIVAHEFFHFSQWMNDIALDEEQAQNEARVLVERYLKLL